MPIVITGQIGDQTHQVCCDEEDMTGSSQVINWILMELGDQPYTLDAMRQLAPRLTRLFGPTLLTCAVEDTPTPEPEEIPAPAEEPPRPETSAPEAVPELEPVEEPV